MTRSRVTSNEVTATGCRPIDTWVRVRRPRPPVEAEHDPPRPPPLAHAPRRPGPERRRRRQPRAQGRAPGLAPHRRVGDVELAAVRRAAPVRPARHLPRGAVDLAERPPRPRRPRAQARPQRPAGRWPTGSSPARPPATGRCSAAARSPRSPSRTWPTTSCSTSSTRPRSPAASGRVFGVRPATFRRLRVQGLSPAAIGARGGRSAVAVRGSLRRLLRARADRAVRVGAMSRARPRRCSPTRRPA